MNKYTTQNHIKELFKKAINKDALKNALNDPEKAKQLKRIFDKVRY